MVPIRAADEGEGNISANASMKGEQKPQPPDSCEVKATAELMTVRLAELVNARGEPTG